MFIKLIKIKFYFLIVISSFKSFSQTPSPSSFVSEYNLKFEHISMEDGLSMNPVMGIVQDNNGYLWFGTADGLNRYDGYNFVVYRHNEYDSTSISDNFITCLLKDYNGNLWIGTHNEGVNRYDVKTDKFLRFKTQSDKEKGIKHNRIFVLIEDKDSILWVGNVSGIDRISIKTGAVIKNDDIAEKLKMLDQHSVLSIYQDLNKNIWIGTIDGLYKFDPLIITLTHYTYNPLDKTSLSHDVVLSSFNDNYGNLWVGTMDGLNLYNPKYNNFLNVRFEEDETNDKKGKTIPANYKKNFSIIDNFYLNTIRIIKADELGRLWLSTDHGLILYNITTQEYKVYKNMIHLPISLSNDMIRSMFTDNSGNLWIGTLGAGLNKLNLKPKKFEHFNINIHNPFGFKENYIRAIVEDSKGNLWFGSIRGGLSMKEKSTGKVYNFMQNNQNPESSVSDNNIWTGIEDREGFLWFGTSFGLNRYDPNSKKFKHFINNPNDSTTISNNYIRNVFQDSKSNLWVGTDNGLNLFNYRTENFKTFLGQSKNYSSMSDNIVWRIIESRYGHLWLATNHSLFKYEVEKNNFTEFYKIDSDTTSLSNNEVRTLYEDKSGILWVGTSYGLNKYDTKTNKFKRYFEKEGLPNSFIYCILEDNKGILWISTNKGITEFNPLTETFRNYDLNDGLQDYEYNTNACYRCKTGEMYFGGPNGLNRFNPETFQENSFRPNIVITNIKVMNNNLKTNAPISEINSITLSHDQNILLLEFSSLDYTNPSRNEYAYKMEGFNKDWIYSGNIRYATYTNLDPSNYVFKVKGTNSDGIWSDKITELKIIITPPFWRTKWFFTFVIFLIIISIYAFIKIRERNLMLAKKNLENKVIERTTEITNQNQIIEQKNKELERLSLVASKSENLVVITDSKGNVEWVNDSFIRLNGASLNEMIASRGPNIRQFSNNTDINNIIDKCVLTKKPVLYESLNITKDGRKVWESSTLTPIYDDKGALKNMIIIDTEITERKNAEEQIRQKNKDITDSIVYARHIQEALFPKDSYVNKFLSRSFGLYMPKDIVSGDFAWFSIKEDKIFIAAVDCTGHGVPGAFLSVLGTSLLNHIINEKQIYQPDAILMALSLEIQKSLHQYDHESDVKDAMDIALCSIKYSYKNEKIVYEQLQYASAFRPLIFFKKQNGSKPELIEYRPDKIAIGGDTEDIKNTKYTNNIINLNPEDTFYIFSDGITDQFGGEKNKKLTLRRFKERLCDMQHLSMVEQKKYLSDFIDKWKNIHEQTDDILIIGVKV